MLIASNLHLDLILEHFPVGPLPTTPLTSNEFSHFYGTTLLSLNLLEHIMNFVSVFQLTDRVSALWAKGLIRIVGVQIQLAFVPIATRIHELSDKFVQIVFASCETFIGCVCPLTPLHLSLNFIFLLLFLGHLKVVLDLIT